MIKIVDNLELKGNELICKDKKGICKPITFLQGRLDGACAIYSVVMDLLILRCINHKDTYIYAEHKSSETKNLFKILMERNGMHCDGRTFNWINLKVRESFSSIVDCTQKRTSNEDSIKLISSYIDGNIPVVISVVGKNFAHAMLAIGYEFTDNGNPTKIFSLDPSGDLPKYSYWNSVIDLYPQQPGNIYKYNYANAFEEYKVYMDDILIINKK